MKVKAIQKVVEWVADVTMRNNTRTMLVCTDARALLDFVTGHIGPLDESSRKSAAIWLEISQRKDYTLTVRGRYGGGGAKLRAVYRLEIA